MPALVRLFKGQWLKTDEGVWTVQPDPAVEDRDIVVANTENFDSLNDLVRTAFGLREKTPMLLTYQLPQWIVEAQGQTWPPHNLSNTADVAMMLTMQEWEDEPRVCVIIGAEAVATYQFRCRAPFTIGSRRFLTEGVTEEQHMATILDMISGNELVCSDSVLNEIFEEDELVAIYRFSFEVEKAKNTVHINLATDSETGNHILSNGGTEVVERDAEARAPDANHVFASYNGTTPQTDISAPVVGEEPNVRADGGST